MKKILGAVLNFILILTLALGMFWVCAFIALGFSVKLHWTPLVTLPVCFACLSLLFFALFFAGRRTEAGKAGRPQGSNIPAGKNLWSTISAFAAGLKNSLPSPGSVRKVVLSVIAIAAVGTGLFFVIRLFPKQIPAAVIPSVKAQPKTDTKPAVKTVRRKPKDGRKKGKNPQFNRVNKKYANRQTI